MADSPRRNVLFLCSGNSCRSQMAEALLRKRAGDRFDVYSAGLDPQPIHPLTYRAMAEAGIDITGQEPTNLSNYLGRLHVHHLIIVCGAAAKACPTTWPGVTERLTWPFDDPAGAEGSEQQKLAEFIRVRDEIDAKLADWLANLDG